MITRISKYLTIKFVQELLYVTLYVTIMRSVEKNDGTHFALLWRNIQQLVESATYLGKENSMSFRKIAISMICIKLIIFGFLELVSRTGLWSLWRDNNLPRYITETGYDWLIVTAYVSWLLFESIIVGIALISKDRGFLIEHG